MARRDQRTANDAERSARVEAPAGPELGAAVRAFGGFQGMDGPSAQDVLALQQSAGNAAVSRMLARQPAEAGPGAAGLIVDDGAEPPPGGMRRSEFVAQVRSVVPVTAATMLEPYATADAQTLEQLLRQHLPEVAAAGSAQEYVDAIAERAGGGSLLGGIGGMLGLKRRDETDVQASLAEHEHAHGAAALAATPSPSGPMTTLRRWASGRRLARQQPAAASMLGCSSGKQQTPVPAATAGPTTTPATPPATTPDAGTPTQTPDGGVTQPDAGTPAADAGATPTPMPGPRANLTILAELDRMHTALAAQGHPSRIGSGYRTIDQQIQIYAKGRTFATFQTDITAAVAAGSVTQAKATEWINYYDPAQGNHPMPPGEPGPVTWTFRSRHLTGDAADIVHATLGWGAPAAFWTALNAAAVAEGLQIGPPASDVAHVQRP